MRVTVRGPAGQAICTTADDETAASQHDSGEPGMPSATLGSQAVFVAATHGPTLAGGDPCPL